MIYFYKYFLSRGYLGILFDKKYSADYVKFMYSAFYKMELIYRIPFAMSIWILILIFILFEVLFLKAINPIHIFNIFRRIFPFSFVFKWSRTMMLMRQGELYDE